MGDYLECADAFLKSEAAQIFSQEQFVKTFMQITNE